MGSKKYSPFEYIRQFSVWITGTITFLTMLVGFIILFRNNTRLVIGLTIITTSIASMLALWRIMVEKTPPLIEGGKGVYKYSNFRQAAIFGLIAIPIINLLIFSSSYGKNLIVSSLYGTPTLVSAIPSSMLATSIPNIEQAIKVNVKNHCKGSAEFLIPYDIDLSGDSTDLMNSFYAQQVWKKWILLDFTPAVDVEVTNLQSFGGKIIFDNKARIVIDSYENLDHADIANFSLGNRWAGEACGGGANARYFSRVGLENGVDLIAIASNYDYYTLGPNEFEEFNFSFICKQPGVYKYHIEIEATHLGEKYIVSIDPKLTTYCPASFSYWQFSNVRVLGTSSNDNILEPHTIEHYTLKFVSPLDLNADHNGEFDNLYVYINDKQDWALTIPWQPCSDSPQSYFVNDSRSHGIIINPDLKMDVNVRADPSLDAQIIYKLDPGTVGYISGGEPVCTNNLVWWRVGWFDNTNHMYEGWAVEGTMDERFLLSCSQNAECNQ